MTVLLYTYTDWQAQTAKFLEQALAETQERLLWIGRKTEPLGPRSVRGTPPPNPFRKLKRFEAEGALPLLDDPIGFEKAHLSAYVYQMSRYSKGYATRAHGLERFHEYRDHFHLTARKLLRLIQREDITSILFFNMPHTGDDFLFYRVAESMGLRVSFLMVSPFDNRFFSTRSIEGYGRLNKNNLAQDDPELTIDALDAQVKTNVESYMGGTYRKENRTFDEVAFAVRTLLRRSPLSFLKPTHLSGAISETIRLQRGLKSRRRTGREIGNGARTRTFLDWLNGLEKDPNKLPKQFVYVPLHFQPEMTTAPQGGVYGDQALAIEMLSACLPDGMEIVAKENPMQGGFHREETFTDRLRQLEKVTVVHPSMNSHVLEEKCAAVATVTGTAGWEAIRDERPCIVFGHAWYQECPGVHKFEDGLDLETVIANPPQRSTSEAFVRHAISKSHQGVVYEAFLKTDDPTSQQQNFQSITRTLKGLALGEIETTFV